MASDLDVTERSRDAAPIASIAVDGLYGKFDYEIGLVANAPDVGAAPFFAVNEDRLVLLYGNNGTGKTTVLRMLFDALSSAPNRGHRNALGRLKFKSLVIEFASGDRVAYTRKAPSTGGFIAMAEVDGRQAQWEWEPGRSRRDYDVDPTTGELVAPDVDAEVDFLNAIETLAVNPVFLTDTRVLISDLVEPERDQDVIYSPGAFRTRGARAVDQIVQRERDSDLRDALNRVRDYLRTLVLAGAQRGSERVDTVYATLAETIVARAARVGRPRKGTIPNLRARVEALGERAEGFTRFGLIPEPPAARLLAALERAEPRDGPLLDQVLTPYLDGLTQRMEELEAGRGAISGYVDTVGSFLEGKRFDFRPARGVEIVDDDTDEGLEPSDLSSGEKQILVLFSDVVALRERTRLFIIDEPELSLNPQWQRNLMPALLQSTEGSAMQLIAATHSIEIMAKYRDRVRQLVLWRESLE